MLRATVGASASHRVAVVDGVSLAYDDGGAGPAVVGLHATGHGSRDFERVRPHLERDVRLITVDWPGHGGSSPDTQPFTAARCEALLGGLLDALRIERATVVGCSIGGAAALRFAAHHPGRVRAVVACDPGGLAPVDGTAQAFCGAMASLARAGAAGRWWFSPLFSLFCRQVLTTSEAREQRARIIAQGHECAVPLEQAWESFRTPEADIRALAARVECPVLFAWARSDRIVSLARSRAALSRVPRHELVTFRGGHCAFLEAAADFSAAFGRFHAAVA